MQLPEKLVGVVLLVLQIAVERRRRDPRQADHQVGRQRQAEAGENADQLVVLFGLDVFPVDDLKRLLIGRLDRDDALADDPAAGHAISDALDLGQSRTRSQPAVGSPLDGFENFAAGAVGQHQQSLGQEPGKPPGPATTDRGAGCSAITVPESPVAAGAGRLAEARMDRSCARPAITVLLFSYYEYYDDSNATGLTARRRTAPCTV